MALNIKAAMQQRNITLTKLAKRMDISLPTAHQVMNDNNLTLRTLIRAAKALHCDVAELFDRPKKWYLEMPEEEAEKELS